MKQQNTFLSRLERLLLVTGTMLLLIYAAALIHRQLFSRLALWEFDKSAPAGAANAPATAFSSAERLDVVSGIEPRPMHFPERSSAKDEKPIAVLRFERLGVRVPVFEGTSKIVLNHGAGWIPGTSRPGEVGNIGIAGHRDGFFRVLKDLTQGDEIELSLREGSARYTVDQISIVSPNDIEVLKSRGVPSLTLVTCYPFHFVGPAPHRYVIHAALRDKSIQASYVRNLHSDDSAKEKQ